MCPVRSSTVTGSPRRGASATRTGVTAAYSATPRTCLATELLRPPPKTLSDHRALLREALERQPAALQRFEDAARLDLRPLSLCHRTSGPARSRTGATTSGRPWQDGHLEAVECGRPLVRAAIDRVEDATRPSPGAPIVTDDGRGDRGVSYAGCIERNARALAREAADSAASLITSLPVAHGCIDAFTDDQVALILSLAKDRQLGKAEHEAGGSRTSRGRISVEGCQLHDPRLPLQAPEMLALHVRPGPQSASLEHP